jgi:hypothetical protein
VLLDTVFDGAAAPVQQAFDRFKAPRGGGLTPYPASQPGPAAQPEGTVPPSTPSTWPLT